MIAKGTTHNSGPKLAAYLISTKENERAELYQLKGFADDNVIDAFRSVHVMADATKCAKPFYHCQVRTPSGEELTREQWLAVADRIETKLGLNDQPRAIAFHLKDGHEHMHVAWSRIDEETLTAKELRFDHRRLMEVCRELEQEMGLTRVPSTRGERDLAPPPRDEMEQARRLEIDGKAVRRAIRDAWDASDNGRDFIDELFQRELCLARGDRRDFVVVDPQGGLHALGRRVTGNTMAEVRERLADLDRPSLLSIADTREAMEGSRSTRYQIEPPDFERTTERGYVKARDGRAAQPRPDHAGSRAFGGAASLLAEGAAAAAEKSVELLGSLFDVGEGSAADKLPVNSPPEPVSMTRKSETEPRDIQASIVRNAQRESAGSDPTVGAAYASNPAAATPDIEQQILNRWRKQREQERDRER